MSTTSKRVQANTRAAKAAADSAKRVRDLQRQLKEASAGVEADKRLKAERAQWARERALLERGITDEDGRAVAETLWGRLPAADRPEIGAWLDTLREDPTKAPRALTAYLPAAAAAEPAARPRGAAPAQQPGARPAPRQAPAARSGEESPTAGGSITREAVRAAGERARREGTPEARQAYATLRDRLMTERNG